MIARDRLDPTRHLLQRTGFAEAPVRVARIADEDRSEVIDSLFEPSALVAETPGPGWIGSPIVTYRAIQAGLEDPARKRLARRALGRAERALIRDLRAWWLATLIRTPDVLGARMTLFWQNHFTSGHRKVRHAALLHAQQMALARNSLGSFRTLVGTMLTDPAMLLYLDASKNRKTRPNENLARELLELFTLGDGHYTETDVREMARALTGLAVDETMAFRFRPEAHDPGDKTILGDTGTFFGIQPIVDTLLARPAAARTVATKLWKHFVSPTPDVDIVEDWSRSYRDSDYDTGTLVRRILQSPAFDAPQNRGRLVKSPIEFVVGAHRALGLPPSENATLVRACLSMQQTPYEPPDVRGWIGGTQWINAQTLLARERFVNRLLRDDRIDPAVLAADLKADEIVMSLLPESGLAGTLDRRGSAADVAGPFDARRSMTAALDSPLWHLK